MGTTVSVSFAGVIWTWVEVCNCWIRSVKARELCRSCAVRPRKRPWQTSGPWGSWGWSLLVLWNSQARSDIKVEIWLLRWLFWVCSPSDFWMPESARIWTSALKLPSISVDLLQMSAIISLCTCPCVCETVYPSCYEQFKPESMHKSVNEKKIGSPTSLKGLNSGQILISCVQQSICSKWPFASSSELMSVQIAGHCR